MRGLARALCLVALALLAPRAADAASRGAVQTRPATGKKGRLRARAAAPRTKGKRPQRSRRALATGRRAAITRFRDPRSLADRAVARAAELGLKGDEAIDAAVEDLMDEAKAHGIDVSLSIGSLGGRNRNITSRFAFNQHDPAGNLRLVTAAYALDALGPDHRFATAFSTDGGGNLYVAGASLDPTLDQRALAGAARALRASGLTRIEGDLVLAGGAPPAERIRAALGAAGIDLRGAVRTGIPPPGAATRHVHRSDPLAAIVRRSVAGEPVDQEAMARAANGAQKTATPIPDGAAGISRFLGARVRLRRFNREFAIGDLSAGRSTLSSDQMLAVLRFARRHERTAPLLASLAEGPDGRVVAATARHGAAVSRAGFVRAGRAGKADVGFAALARARTAAERQAAEAWLDALALTLARIEPRAPRPRAADPASWPAVPKGRLELETTFGQPGEYVVRHRLPIGPGGRMAQVRINRKLIPVLEAALAEAAGRDLVKHIARFGGTFKLRTKRRPDGTELQPPVFSTHSYGVAFDLNPDTDGGQVHPELGALFERYGFVWGKYFAHNYDPMHFQFVADY